MSVAMQYNGRAIAAVESSGFSNCVDFDVIKKTHSWITRSILDSIAAIACSVLYDSPQMKCDRKMKINGIRIARPFGVNRQGLRFSKL